MANKKKSQISRLIEIAGEKKGLLALSAALSVLSTLLFFCALCGGVLHRRGAA